MQLERVTRNSFISLIILIFAILVIFPLGQLFTYAAREGLGIFADRLVAPEARGALWLTIEVGIATTVVNLFVGTAVAFVLHRSQLRFKSVLDALVDIPLAIPTIVIGFALLLLYGPQGWLGQYLDSSVLQILFSFPGILLAHVFVTFPFMVRSVGTALEGLDPNYEKAAKTLGASVWQTFYSVTLPGLKGGLIAGSVLTFSKSIGEFGATLMVSGNLLGKTQTGPLYIFSRFNTGDIEGASAIALVLAVFSFVILFVLKIATAERKGDVPVEPAN